MGDMRIIIDGAPPETLRNGPEVGEVYKKDGGPAGFMLLVYNGGSVFHYLIFDIEGRITGVGQGTPYYFSRRSLVGRVNELPPIVVEWFK